MSYFSSPALSQLSYQHPSSFARAAARDSRVSAASITSAGVSSVSNGQQQQGGRKAKWERVLTKMTNLPTAGTTWRPVLPLERLREINAFFSCHDEVSHTPRAAKKAKAERALKRESEDWEQAFREERGTEAEDGYTDLSSGQKGRGQLEKAFDESGQLPSQEEDEAVIDLLDSADGDVNPEIDEETFIACFGELLVDQRPSVSELREWFRDIDINIDGSVSWQEFTTYIVEQSRRGAAAVDGLERARRFAPIVNPDVMLPKWNATVSRMAVHETGARRSVVSVGHDGLMRIWDPFTCTCRLTINNAANSPALRLKQTVAGLSAPSHVACTDAVFNNRGTHCFVSGSDKSVAVYEVGEEETFELSRLYLGITDRVGAASSTANTASVSSASPDDASPPSSPSGSGYATGQTIVEMLKANAAPLGSRRGGPKRQQQQRRSGSVGNGGGGGGGGDSPFSGNPKKMVDTTVLNGMVEIPTSIAVSTHSGGGDLLSSGGANMMGGGREVLYVAQHSGTVLVYPTMRLSRVGELDPIATLTPHRQRITKARFVPQLRGLVTASWDTTIALTDVERNAPLYVFGDASTYHHQHHNQSRGGGLLPSLSPSPSGAPPPIVKTYASASASVGAASDSSMSGHQRVINDFVYSAQHRLIASCGGDRAVLLWALGMAYPIASLEGHSAALLSLAIDGSTLMSLDVSNVIKIWDLRTHKLIQSINTSVGTDSEEAGNSSPTSNHAVNTSCIAFHSKARSIVACGRQTLIYSTKRGGGGGCVASKAAAAVSSSSGDGGVGHTEAVVGFTVVDSADTLLTADSASVFGWNAANGRSRVTWDVGASAHAGAAAGGVGSTAFAPSPALDEPQGVISAVTTDMAERKAILLFSTGEVIIYNHRNGQRLATIDVKKIMAAAHVKPPTSYHLPLKKSIDPRLKKNNDSSTANNGENSKLGRSLLPLQSHRHISTSSASATDDHHTNPPLQVAHVSNGENTARYVIILYPRTFYCVDEAVGIMDVFSPKALAMISTHTIAETQRRDHKATTTFSKGGGGGAKKKGVGQKTFAAADAGDDEAETFTAMAHLPAIGKITCGNLLLGTSRGRLLVFSPVMKQFLSKLEHPLIRVPTAAMLGAGGGGGGNALAMRTPNVMKLGLPSNAASPAVGGAPHLLPPIGLGGSNASTPLPRGISTPFTPSSPSLPATNRNNHGNASNASPPLSSTLSVEDLVILHHHDLAATCLGDTRIYVWDMRRITLRGYVRAPTPLLSLAAPSRGSLSVSAQRRQWQRSSTVAGGGGGSDGNIDASNGGDGGTAMGGNNSRSTTPVAKLKAMREGSTIGLRSFIPPPTPSIAAVSTPSASSVNWFGRGRSNSSRGGGADSGGGDNSTSNNKTALSPTFITLGDLLSAQNGGTEDKGGGGGGGGATVSARAAARRSSVRKDIQMLASRRRQAEARKRKPFFSRGGEGEDEDDDSLVGMGHTTSVIVAGDDSGTVYVFDSSPLGEPSQASTSGGSFAPPSPSALAVSSFGGEIVLPLLSRFKASESALHSVGFASSLRLIYCLSTGHSAVAVWSRYGDYVGDFGQRARWNVKFKNTFKAPVEGKQRLNNLGFSVAGGRRGSSGGKSVSRSAAAVSATGSSSKSIPIASRKDEGGAVAVAPGSEATSCKKKETEKDEEEVTVESRRSSVAGMVIPGAIPVSTPLIPTLETSGGGPQKDCTNNDGGGDGDAEPSSASGFVSPTLSMMGGGGGVRGATHHHLGSHLVAAANVTAIEVATSPAVFAVKSDERPAAQPNHEEASSSSSMSLPLTLTLTQTQVASLSALKTTLATSAAAATVPTSETEDAAAQMDTTTQNGPSEESAGATTSRPSLATERNDSSIARQAKGPKGAAEEDELAAVVVVGNAGAAVLPLTEITIHPPNSPPSSASSSASSSSSDGDTSAVGADCENPFSATLTQHHDDDDTITHRRDDAKATLAMLSSEKPPEHLHQHNVKKRKEKDRPLKLSPARAVARRILRRDDNGVLGGVGVGGRGGNAAVAGGDGKSVIPSIISNRKSVVAKLNGAQDNGKAAGEGAMTKHQNLRSTPSKEGTEEGSPNEKKKKDTAVEEDGDSDAVLTMAASEENLSVLTPHVNRSVFFDTPVSPMLAKLTAAGNMLLMLPTSALTAEEKTAPSPLPSIQHNRFGGTSVTAPPTSSSFPSKSKLAMLYSETLFDKDPMARVPMTTHQFLPPLSSRSGESSFPNINSPTNTNDPFGNRSSGTASPSSFIAPRKTEWLARPATMLTVHAVVTESSDGGGSGGGGGRGSLKSFKTDTAQKSVSPIGRQPR